MAKAKPTPSSKRRRKSGKREGSGEAGAQAKPKKTAPARTVKPSGRLQTHSRRKRPGKAKIAKPRGKVKAPGRPKRSAGKASKAPEPRRAAARKRKAPSKHPEAVRSRQRRLEAKWIAEAALALHEEKLERRRERQRQKKRGGGGIVKSERQLAEGWLEHARQDVAEIVPCVLSIVGAEAGTSTAWMIVGRFDLAEGIGYQTLGEIFERLLADDLLTAKIHPERLSQIRVIFHDPNAKRGEGDSIVSKIAGWEFALGDMIGEILGGGPDDPGALAVRYDETAIETFYIYFSSTITAYETAGPWAKTQTVKWR